MKNSNINLFEGFIKPKKFNDTIKNLTIYAESKDDNGNLKNIYIKKSNKSGTQITFSKTGEFVQKNGTKVLVLYNGQTINENKNNISNFSFSESDFSFINLKSNTTTTIKTQETSTLELINCIKDLNTLKKKIKRKFN